MLALDFTLLCSQAERDLELTAQKFSPPSLESSNSIRVCFRTEARNLILLRNEVTSSRVQRFPRPVAKLFRLRVPAIMSSEHV